MTDFQGESFYWGMIARKNFFKKRKEIPGIIWVIELNSYERNNRRNCQRGKISQEEKEFKLEDYLWENFSSRKNFQGGGWLLLKGKVGIPEWIEIDNFISIYHLSVDFYKLWNKNISRNLLNTKMNFLLKLKSKNKT